jgi:hypothetical protein
MPVGMLEAFQLAEEIGHKCLTTEELLFLTSARRRKGCRLKPNRLTAEERARVCALGDRCKKWKEEHR